jgi:hypothetical protein
VTSNGLLDEYQRNSYGRFVGTCCLHLLPWNMLHGISNPKERNSENCLHKNVKSPFCVLIRHMALFKAGQQLATAGRSGDWIPVGTRFSVLVQTSLGAQPASYIMGTGSFLEVKRPGRGGNHPPHLTSKLKKEYNYTSIPLWAFMACSRAKCTLPCTHFFITVRGTKLGVENRFYLLHTCSEGPWDPTEYPVQWEPVLFHGGKGAWAWRRPRISIWHRPRFRICTTVPEIPVCAFKACHRQKLYWVY